MSTKERWEEEGYCCEKGYDEARSITIMYPTPEHKRRALRNLNIPVDVRHCVAGCLDICIQGNSLSEPKGESYPPDMPVLLNSNEAIMGFVAWLTRRDEPVTFSAKHDAGVGCDLIRMFVKANKLPNISKDWPKNLVYPKE